MTSSSGLQKECYQGLDRGCLRLHTSERDSLLSAIKRLAQEKHISAHLEIVEEDEAEQGGRQPSLRASKSRSRSGSSKRRARLQKQPSKETVDPPKSMASKASNSSWGGRLLDDCQVIEVETPEEKKAAYNLHLSKNTFHEERQLVEFRIQRGELCQCRTWVLIPGKSRQSSMPVDDGKGGRGRGRGPVRRSERNIHVCAAVTVRINRYTNRQARWAQILNMSTVRERQGYGTVLIAGLEELLRMEDTDVVVLYPAENGRAPGFWSGLGFGPRSESHLPEEELIPYDKGGPLLPEYDPGSKVPLPRWEKRLQQGAENDSVVSNSDSDLSKVKGRSKQPSKKESDFRLMPASASRLGGADLKAASDLLLEQRKKLKVALLTHDKPIDDTVTTARVATLMPKPGK